MNEALASKQRYNRKEVLLLASGGLLSLIAVSCGGRPKERQPALENIPQPEKYPQHRVVATIFYVGESASASNGYIDNISTAWEDDARIQFGGVDDPDRRNAEGVPADFRPKENPFYVALPASEFNKRGLIPGAREMSPWAKEAVTFQENRSLFKGRWVGVKNPENGVVVYGQWLDTGPSDDPSDARDYQYVFGDSSAKPKNSFGLKAGIDVSPAMTHQLGFDIAKGGIEVIWQFVDSQDVPDGTWKDFPEIDNRTYWN